MASLPLFLLRLSFFFLQFQRKGNKPQAFIKQTAVDWRRSEAQSGNHVCFLRYNNWKMMISAGMETQ